jgi:GNAT superfamily N-acetyltransferase
MAAAEGLAFDFVAGDDADLLACFDRYYAELASRFEGGFDPSSGGYAGSVPGDPSRSWALLVRQGGRAVGCGMLKQIAPGTGEVKRVWCDPALRGQGIARRVMDVLEARALAEGLPLMRLDTNRALTEARGMYLRRGYVEIAPYNDNAYADHWFEKRLDQSQPPLDPATSTPGR